MISSSAEFNTAVLEGGHPYQIRILRYTKGPIINGWVPLDVDIFSCIIHKGATGSETFGYCSTFVPYIEMEISAPTVFHFSSVNYGQEIRLQIGLDIEQSGTGRTTEWINIGYFTVTNIESLRTKIKFTAYGRLGTALSTLVPEASEIFPEKKEIDHSGLTGISVQDILDTVEATMVNAGFNFSIRIENGITTGGNNASSRIIMDNDGQIEKVTESETGRLIIYVHNPFLGFTCRQLLDIVALYIGAYCSEDSEGNVVLFKYDTSSPIEYDGSFMTAFPTFVDDTFTVNGITWVDRKAVAPIDGGGYTEIDVPIWEGTPDWRIYRPDNNQMPSFANSIRHPYNYHHFINAYKNNVDVNVSYTPAIIPLAIGDPRLEPWDVLSFTDSDETEYIIPCMDIVHTVAGATTSVITVPKIEESVSGGGEGTGSGGMSGVTWGKIEEYVQTELASLAQVHGRYYGTCATAKSTKAKEVTLTDDTGFALTAGVMVAVKFTYASAAATMTLNVNNTGAKTIYQYGTTEASSETTTSGWPAGATVIFVYDGSAWFRSLFVNTTYSGMTAAEITAGSGTTNRLITPANLKTAIQTWDTDVSCSQTLTSGVEIGAVTVDGAETKLYAPTGSVTTFYGTSDTAANVADKVVTCEGFEDARGNILGVTFKNANTYTEGTLSLCINSSTHGHPIYKGGVVVSSTNPLTWEAHTTLLFQVSWPGPQPLYNYLGSSSDITDIPLASATQFGAIEVQQYYDAPGGYVEITSGNATPPETTHTVALPVIESRNQGTIQEIRSKFLPDATTTAKGAVTLDTTLSSTSSNPLTNSGVHAALSDLAARLELRSPAVYFDTTANWNAQTTLQTESNAIYVYTDLRQTDDNPPKNIAGVKIGDGNAYLIDKPFLDEIYYDHITDSTIHTTSAEKTFWNNKVTAYYSLTNAETLVLSKNAEPTS